MAAQKNQLILIGAWSLTGLVCLLAILAWGHDYAWHLLPFNTYQFFPLLGLLAYSIMWSHYVNSAVRQLLKVDAVVLKRQFQYTGYAVLVLICLHPGLLIYQRFRDGYGLPPHSYESYVMPGLGWVTLLGTASLLVFLAYELRRFYSNRSWWHWVPMAGDLAMLVIFYHGLRLGHQLSHQGWFRDVWFGYGIILVVVLARSYYQKWQRRQSKKPAV